MSNEAYVFIVDDDDAVRDGYGQIMETADFAYKTFASAEEFLDGYIPGERGCLLLDICMPGLSGLELQTELTNRNIRLPIIFLTGYGNIPMTVSAMKAGAVDFLSKPVSRNDLIAHIKKLIQEEAELFEQQRAKQSILGRINKLTTRELEILPLILSGYSNKQIAKQLGISHRTVEIHRTRILYKTGSANLLELSHFCEASRLNSVSKPK